MPLSVFSIALLDTLISPLASMSCSRNASVSCRSSIRVCKASYLDVTVGGAVPGGTGVGSLTPLRIGNISKVTSNVVVSVSNRTVSSQ